MKVLDKSLDKKLCCGVLQGQTTQIEVLTTNTKHLIFATKLCVEIKVGMTHSSRLSNKIYLILECFSLQWWKLIGLAPTALHNWLKNLTPLFIQLEVKLEPIMTRLHIFSCTSCQLHVITLSFDWFTILSVSSVIGYCDNFGFGFTTLNWKLPYLSQGDETFVNGLWYKTLGKDSWYLRPLMSDTYIFDRFLKWLMTTNTCSSTTSNTKKSCKTRPKNLSCDGRKDGGIVVNFTTEDYWSIMINHLINHVFLQRIIVAASLVDKLAKSAKDRVFKFSRHLVQVTCYYKHLHWVSNFINTQFCMLY